MIRTFARLAGALHVLLACMLAALAVPAGAHPSPSSQVLLSAGADTVAAEVTLPVGELQLAFPSRLVDATGHWSVVPDSKIAAYLAAHVRPVAPDGRAWSVKVEAVRWELDRTPADIVVDMVLRPPTGAPPGSFDLAFDAIAHQVPNHNTLVALRDGTQGSGARPHMLGSLYYGHHVIAIRDLAPHWWTGFGGLFKLGMLHIAEGSDHLLFLLTLLLPAALCVRDGRWAGYAGARQLLRNLLGVVTAFTLGHSLTLLLGAAGLARVAPQPVEVAIALSILVSAAHAWKPIFPAREAWIAGGFGLVHGLAFASALSDLHLAGARLAAGVLAFNLGIETVQALLVLLVTPALVVLARTRYYPRVRQVTAVLAMAMALLWIFVRITNVDLLGIA